MSTWKISIGPFSLEILKLLAQAKIKKPPLNATRQKTSFSMNLDSLNACITPEFLTHDQITGNEKNDNNRSEREFVPQDYWG
jgi:hypothetical protein